MATVNTYKASKILGMPILRILQLKKLGKLKRVKVADNKYEFDLVSVKQYKNTHKKVRPNSDVQ